MTSVLDKHLGRANAFFPPLAKQLSENARMTDFFASVLEMRVAVRVCIPERERIR